MIDLIMIYCSVTIIICLFIILIILLIPSQTMEMWYAKSTRRHIEKNIYKRKYIHPKCLREFKNLDISSYLFIKEMLSNDIYRILFAFLSDKNKILPLVYINERTNHYNFIHYYPYPIDGKNKLPLLHFAFSIEATNYNGLLHLPYADLALRKYDWNTVSDEWRFFLKNAYTLEERNLFDKQIANFKKNIDNNLFN